MTSKVTYLGALRTTSTHIKSGSQIISDAPTEINGKGEAFSPTDIVANALASCMMTTMGIKAKKMNIDLEGSIAEVTKIMNQKSHGIAGIEITFHMNAVADDRTKLILERVAHSCPVELSLHPDIKRIITFHWK